MRLKSMTHTQYALTLCIVIAVGLITGAVLRHTGVFIGTGVTAILLASLIPLK